jgi:two-component system, NarL family, response regulator LiaR
VSGLEQKHISEAKIRVMLVDDHPMVREGLRTFLQLSKQMEVVAEAESGPEACDKVEHTDIDVILMDLVMPGEFDGIEAIRVITSKKPQAKVIALTSFQDRERILGALDAGAIGYLQKDIRPDELLGAIRQAASGRTVLEAEALLALRQTGQQSLHSDPSGNHPTSSHISSERSDSNAISTAGVGHTLCDTVQQGSGVLEYTEPLTDREHQVLQSIAKGMSNKEIADYLGSAEKTVKVHVSHILSKLGVYDRTQALLVASRLGLVKIQ